MKKKNKNSVKGNFSWNKKNRRKDFCVQMSLISPKDDYLLPLFPHIEEVGKVNIPLICDLPQTIDQIAKRDSLSLFDRVKLLILNWNSRPVYKTLHLQYGMDFSKFYHMTVVEMTRATGLHSSDIYNKFLFRGKRQWPRKYVMNLIHKVCKYIDSGDTNIQYDENFQTIAKDLIESLQPVECDNLVRIFIRRKVRNDIAEATNNNEARHSRKPKRHYSHIRPLRGCFLLTREKLQI